ncbi:MAG: urease accessory protein UreF [Bauldia sp.]
MKLAAVILAPLQREIGGLGRVHSRSALNLATWLSPAFPTGAFSYSHGLETAIADGRLRTPEEVEAWIAALLTNGSGWGDAVLLAEAWRAAADGDFGRIRRAAELGTAMSPSAERQRETTALGEAFLKAVMAGWPSSALSGAMAAAGEAMPYPVAVGVAAAAHDLPLGDTLALSLNAFVSTLVSVAVRLVPLGQSAGLRIQAALQPLILATAVRAERSTLDDLGSAAILSDIASMRHETLYSRVFRS